MDREPLTKPQMMENALREIAAQAGMKGGEWASDQAFQLLEHLEIQTQQ